MSASVIAAAGLAFASPAGSRSWLMHHAEHTNDRLLMTNAAE
jgi:hypothetical protein